MSADAMKWAWGVEDLAPAERVVLLRLAWHADLKWPRFPSVPDLVTETQLSKRTVYSALQALAKRDLLTVDHGGRGRGNRNVYAVKVKGAESAPLDDGKGAESASLRVQNLHSKGADSAPNTISKELEVLEVGRGAPRTRSVALNGHGPKQFTNSAERSSEVLQRRIGARR